MSNTAFQTQYREEFIAGFEQRTSLLRKSCTTDTVRQGNADVFLVADSNSGTAVTRGVNGLIPSAQDNLTQNTVTLQEWHDLREATNFNIFASQGNRKAIMQMNSMAVINRKIDDDIIAQLDTCTIDTGDTTVAASMDLVIMARTILGVNFVPLDEVDNLFMLVTPAFIGFMLQIPEFASSLYVDVKPLASNTGGTYRRWAGFNWIEHPRLTGVATNTEKCYAFHRSAIGHAVGKGDMESLVGYDEKQNASWARTSIYMGSKLLQNNGVVQMLHDGSRYQAK